MFATSLATNLVNFKTICLLLDIEIEISAANNSCSLYDVIYCLTIVRFLQVSADC